MFETGNAQIDPKNFENVIAMCSGNFIYIPMHILRDPSESMTPRICRVIGNVGEPGVVLFVPPPESVMQELDPESWQLINHCSWDGKLGDSFGQAYLNLSLTDYLMPLVTQDSQTKPFGPQITLRESIVSLSDGGTWVADLDILAGLKRMDLLFRIPEPSEPCDHFNDATTSKSLELIAVDNWAEFLDPPESPVIIRCHGNWIGRLGATILSIQKGHPTILIPPKVTCKTCVSEMVEGETEVRTRGMETCRLHMLARCLPACFSGRLALTKLLHFPLDYIASRKRRV